eukprot:gnl/TRDRNA2_/TRDRNA2_133260_c0_seq1.p2 gnl/TRDRNA2_/TRDRNA2_133260_c0~~gnl/TRDRNA2_/TRDRNA2_133260_c0_seq1.p2  ORF type:complete len:224 (-),score=51.39 gnl/TRDRNA2_/TRDRNA2_133260_c0_seq1:90-761(-)
MLRLPGGVSSVIIDVGTASSSEFMPALMEDPSLLLIGLEPQAALIEELQRSSREVLSSSCFQRLWLIRAAAGPETLGPYAHFHRTVFPECSSLLHPGAAVWERGGFFRDCVSLDAIDVVPVLPLEELLKRLPVRVERLKVDAQGADLQVLISAGDFLRKKVQTIELECQELEREDWRRLYPDGHTKAEAISFLQQRGFRLVRCSPNGGDAHPLFEENCVFEAV